MLFLEYMPSIGIGGSFGNYKQDEKTTLKLGENNCKRSNWPRINPQNTQVVYEAQYRKNKQPNPKIGRRPKETFLQRRCTDGQQTRESNLNTYHYLVQFSSVQSISHVQFFVTPWTAEQQASLSITNSQSLLKLTPIKSVIHSTTPSSVVPFSSCLQSFPASRSFPVSLFFTSGGQSIGVSAPASVLPMNIQDWFLLRLTGWLSLQSQGL